MKKITSKDNFHIKNAVKLKQRKFRRIEHEFLVEGSKQVQEGLLCKNMIAKVFVAESEQGKYQDMAKQYADIEWYVVDDKLIKYISDTDTPQGIIAIARIPEYDWSGLSEWSFLLLLDRMSDPGNLGTIIRTAWAFNVEGILLTSGCVDPFSPKVVRSSMGGIFNVPIFCDVSVEDIEMVRSHGFKLLGTSTGGSPSYTEQDYREKCVLVIGSESHGVSDQISSICNDFFTIPINPRVDSLNAGVACAIILSEAFRQRYN